MGYKMNAPCGSKEAKINLSALSVPIPSKLSHNSNMVERLDICLLGGFSLRGAGQAVRGLNAERPQSLLAYLLLHRQAPISRRRLAFTFWPDSSDEQARTNLRNLLHTLRRGLPEADSFLALDTHTVQWRSGSPFTLDVAAFQEALAAAQQASVPALRRQQLETAVSHYKGPLLPGNYDDWLIPLRETLQQEYQDALRQLALLLAESSAWQTAVHYARLLQKEDPLSETAVMLLMQLYAQMGDEAAVRRAYQAGANALRQELDAEPGLALQTAYAHALQHMAATSQAETEWETAVTPSPRLSPRQAPHLPRQATPFVDREAELAKLAAQLANPACRLLTIMGPGGVGKTRLALQAATGHVTIFADGAAFIPLAAITDPLILPSAIAQGLPFTFTRTASRAAQLLQYLADKEMLLVLDNVEQLGPHITFLTDILAAAPHIKLLVTSRQRLQLREEWLFPLQGLPLPSSQQPGDLNENSAVTLFLQVARQHESRFAPTPADMQAIVRICQLVDGMPLGLELAAPWIRLLSCAEISEEIEKNLDFLTSAHQNIPERHRSMRAVFNQSWEMLTPAEQAVFSSLSLFVGGFSREAAEQVAGASLPLLSGLLDKSLVRRLDNGRYDIHELLRQYAASQLQQSADPYAAQSGFAAYYVDLVETAVDHLIGPEQQLWLDTLETEYDNLQAALSWSVAAQETETAVRLGAALGRYWWLRHPLIEGDNWLRQILALPGPHTAHRARAMCYAGMLARLRRDYSAAETWLTQCLQDQQQMDGTLDLGRTLNELGMLYLEQGAFAQAQPLFETWLALARQLESAHGVTIALLNLGMTAQYQDHFQQAEAYYEEGLTLARQHRLLTNVAMILNSYSTLHLELHQWEQARAMLLESMQLNLDLGHKSGLAWSFLGLLTLHHQAGHWETAAHLVGVQERLRRELGAALPPANQLHFEALVADLQQRLSVERLAAFQQQGREMTLEEAASMAQTSGECGLQCAETAVP